MKAAIHALKLLYISQHDAGDFETSKQRSAKRQKVIINVIKFFSGFEQ